MTGHWITVLGVGVDGPDVADPAVRAALAGARHLVGGERHLAMVGAGLAPAVVRRLVWARPLAATMDAIAAAYPEPTVVLATGDPLWFGVGVTLARRFAADAIAFRPGLSAFQLAAAALGWPIADTVCLTLHGRPLARLIRDLAPGRQLLALTDDGAGPAAIARLLTEVGWGASTVVALERLGGATPGRIAATARDWTAARVDDLNTVAILAVPDPDTRVFARTPGLPDEAFDHDGQLTKRLVRAAAMAALAPLPGRRLWDVGAGAGSIAIEWLRACEGTRADAIERDSLRAARIAANAWRLGVPELAVHVSEAPAALAVLAAPDAVFIGGGVTTAGLFERCWDALTSGGRLVATAVTLDGEARLAALARDYGGALDRIWTQSAENIGARRGWRAASPVTLLSLTKP
jgi:precorrin-6Y C5,15-methyltransferase (decarboxylating)